MLDLIYKTLTPEISPMVYIMMGVSVFIGFCFFTGFLASGAESVLYDTGVLVHKKLWGLCLFTTATIAEFGMIFNHDSLITIGGITGFMAWCFAAISLAMASHWYILFSVAIFHLLFHGYVVLATSLGLIRRVPKVLD